MKIGGANAPPNSPTEPQKRGFGRVSGHTLLEVLPGFLICNYLYLNLQFMSEILTKWPLILGFNRSIQGGFFSTGFQPL